MFNRAMQLIIFVGGIGWALIPNPAGSRFGVASVIAGFVLAVGTEYLEWLRAKQGAPRHMSPAQRHAFLTALGTTPPVSIGVRVCASDAEAVDLFTDVAQLLRDAGWAVRDALIVPHPTRQGIAIGVIQMNPQRADLARLFIAAFTAVGLTTNPQIETQISGTLDETVTILIGPKSN
jgi:hypothetical protein